MGGAVLPLKACGKDVCQVRLLALAVPAVRGTIPVTWHPPHVHDSVPKFPGSQVCWARGPTLLQWGLILTD